MYKKNAAKPINGNSSVLRVIFGFGDSIYILHPKINPEKMRVLSLYVLSISAKLGVSCLDKVAHALNLGFWETAKEKRE